MTQYRNPLTGAWETREEMEARPPELHGETVLASDTGQLYAPVRIGDIGEAPLGPVGHLLTWIDGCPKVVRDYPPQAPGF